MTLKVLNRCIPQKASSSRPESSGGRWTVPAATMLTGIVYVPCAVTITGSRQQLTTTLVAEGPITLAGSSLTISPATVGRTALVSAASGNDAIRITGADVRIQGTTQALNGQVSLTGA